MTRAGDGSYRSQTNREEPEDMNIHEYQAKAVLSKYGVTVPKGKVADTPAEAEASPGSSARPSS